MKTKKELQNLILDLNSIVKLHTKYFIMLQSKKELINMVLDQYIPYFNSSNNDLIINFIKSNLYLLVNKDILNYTVRENLLYKSKTKKEFFQGNFNNNTTLEKVNINLLNEIELIDLYQAFLVITSITSIRQQFINILNEYDLEYLYNL